MAKNMLINRTQWLPNLSWHSRQLAVLWFIYFIMLIHILLYAYISPTKPAYAQPKPSCLELYIFLEGQKISKMPTYLYTS